MIQFYMPEINAHPVLPADESGHCVRVLRMKEGDPVICVDGAGSRYECIIADAHPKHVALQVLKSYQLQKSWHNSITLCVAPTKNIDRIEWMLEKCTEMGIDRIIPVRCTHSERKDIKPERLRKILISAMKQSLKATLPILEDLVPITDAINTIKATQKFICYCAESIPKRNLCQEYMPGADVAILIGPEGDFSDDEVKMAIDHGWRPVSLGDCRLRTETAGVFAVASVHAINQKELR